MNRYKGFTLVELMVVIALLAIMAAIAIPGFTDFIKRNETESAADDVNRLLQYARNQAIATRSAVIVKRDTGSNKWVVTVRGAESRTLDYSPNKVNFSTDLSDNQVTFNAYGAANKASKISICRGTDNDNGYLLEVKRSGRITLSTRGGAPEDCEV